MAEHVVCRADEIPPGKARRVEIDGRAIAVFNLGDRFAAIGDRCPHEGASLSYGCVLGLIEAARPGEFTLDMDRKVVRCPWHGWDFDLATGRSYCDPNRMRVRAFDVRVGEPDAAGNVEGPYRIEVFDVATRDAWVILTV